MDWRRHVERAERLGERADRMFLKNRDDGFQPLELGGMKVHGVAAGCERRVLETLEILPHIRNDRVDDVAGVASRRRRNGLSFVRDHRGTSRQWEMAYPRSEPLRVSSGDGCSHQPAPPGSPP